VAATGVVVARNRRAPAEYSADELREKLHRRLDEASANGSPSQPAPGPAAGSR
jgi:hypothetical protein